MSEFIGKEFPYLRSLGREREGLGLEKLNIEELSAQSGSQDPVLVEQAKSLLRRKWELDPGRDAENAPSIDLMEQLKAFSEEERLAMFSQLVGIQLTEGCNGNCPFCLFGKKKGVEAKYSFESLSVFLRNYGSSFSDEPLFYWDSDPFDYRDGGKNFTDVYRVWREIRPKEYHFVSTAIPRGGEEDFIDFMRHAAQEWREEKQIILSVRISLAKHNVQRAEAVFEKLTAALIGDGFSKESINIFFKDCVKTGKRFFDNAESAEWKLGSLISSHDDIKDVQTPACSDGVLITPRSLKAIMITAPTVYEPSGEKDVVITPGQVTKQIPAKLHISDYHAKILSPILLAENKGEYKLENTVDDLVLRLGREAASCGRAIGGLTEIFFPEEKFIKFIKISNFEERKEKNNDLIERAQKLVSGGNLTPAESEKLQFYILLNRTHLAEMDFIVGQIKSGPGSIRTIAEIFQHVGRNQVARLPQIIEDMAGIREKAKQGQVGRNDIPAIKYRMTINLSQYFGFGNNPPYWLQQMVGSYCDSLETGEGVWRKKSWRDFLNKFSILK